MRKLESHRKACHKRYNEALYHLAGKPSLYDVEKFRIFSMKGMEFSKKELIMALMFCQKEIQELKKQ